MEEGWVVGLVWGYCFPERIGTRSTRLSYMHVIGKYLTQSKYVSYYYYYYYSYVTNLGTQVFISIKSEIMDGF